MDISSHGCRGCKSGKLCYATRGTAKKALKWFRSRGKLLTRVYRCQICGHYHLTKKELRT